MKILMLYPKYPEATFWNINHSQWKFERRRAALPPLGLLTVAGYLPEDFEIRLIDRNIREESEADYRWADVVFLSLMGVQKDDYRICVSQARRFGKPIAVGGPFTHAFPEEAARDGDWVCYGEIESIVQEFVADLREGRQGKQYQGGNKTNMETVPVPRYDVLENIHDYGTMAVQFSRGCPFLCEFCDIIEIYGRVPRAKKPEQILAELDLIKKLGYDGNIFIVDDNFIGNKKKAAAMLRELAVWNRIQDSPFKFYTEASLNLADEEDLMQAMSDANMLMVFIGIETPDPVLLKGARKHQNIPGDQLEKLAKVRRHGIHITAGFILGFDGEKSEIFDFQKDFIQASGIGVDMLGLLVALPHTQLSRRLKKEGRLLEKLVPMEQTVDGINYIPKGDMTKREYLQHYAAVVVEIYRPEIFFGRILPALLQLKRQSNPGKVSLRLMFKDLRIFSRQLFFLGIMEKGSRRLYWKTLFRLIRENPRAIESFAMDCIFYYHLKRHSQFIQKSIAQYLSHPLPDDVLDQKYPPAAIPTAQAVGY